MRDPTSIRKVKIDRGRYLTPSSAYHIHVHTHVLAHTNAHISMHHTETERAKYRISVSSMLLRIKKRKKQHLNTL